jgi:hypothetical protein
VCIELLTSAIELEPSGRPRAKDKNEQAEGLRRLNLHTGARRFCSLLEARFLNSCVRVSACSLGKLKVVESLIEQKVPADAVEADVRSRSHDG